MAKSVKQKLKSLYLLEMLRTETDETHRLTMPQIIEKLALHGISAERKSIYSDIEELNLFGFDILRDKDGYFLASRDFELAELKLLVDSVQASRFITEKKSAVLISKLEKLASRHEANELHRQVYVANRPKTANETVYYSVDTVYEAIRRGKEISFRYFEYKPDKSRLYRNDGEPYRVSPYAMTVAENNYYLVAHDPKREGLSHYRVDRMTDIEICNEDAIALSEVMGENFNIGEYYRKNFNMFAGEPAQVHLLCQNQLANAIIDRFGESVFMRPEGDGRFVASVQVSVSPTFFAWVFTFGDAMKIVGPEDVRREFAEKLQRSAKSYGLG